MTENADQSSSVPSRRDVLTTSVGALAGAAVGIGAMSAWQARRDAGPSAPDATADPHGTTQAGIDRPSTPQAFALFQVADLDDAADTGFLAALGRRISSLISTPTPMLPDGPRGLTVTIGLGPRVVRALKPQLPGAEPLPEFHADDQIAAEANGGDLLIACCADDPAILPPVVEDLLDRVPGAIPRWSQFGYRGPGRETVARNPLGFLDGISVPHTSEEFANNVWLDGPLSGGTICVIRRLRLKIADFTGLPYQKS